MPHPRCLIASLLAAITLALAACSTDTAGKDAVAVGGTFQFHSPGGETSPTPKPTANPLLTSPAPPSPTPTQKSNSPTTKTK